MPIFERGIIYSFLWFSSLQTLNLQKHGHHKIEMENLAQAVGLCVCVCERERERESVRERDRERERGRGAKMGRRERESGRERERKWQEEQRKSSSVAPEILNFPSI